MEYREYRPQTPFLARFIRCFWSLSRLATEDVERIVPDGSPELVFHLSDPFIEHLADGGLNRQEPALLVGELTRCARVQPTGQSEVLGVRFRPGGLAPLLAAPMSEWRDRIVPLEDAGREMAARFLSALHDAPDESARVVALAREMNECLTAADPPDLAVEFVTRAIEASRGTVSISDLATRCGLSSRQLQRKFQIAVGVGPKVLCRIIRFQRCIHDLGNGRGLARAALDAGYFDQAHLNRDFLAFAGVPPTTYAAEKHRVSDAIARGDTA